MNLNKALEAELADLDSNALRRHLRTLESAQGAKVSLEGEPLVNFSSNDYLGLAWNRDLIEASQAALRRCGTGSGASRLISGNLDIHSALDEALAAFKATEAALSFNSGYAAALSVIPALLDKRDTVILDKLSHACLVDAARLSEATMRIFPHNDLSYLEKILRRTRASTDQSEVTKRPSRILIVTESVFSMDGDTAPLRDLCDLKDRYGAWLLVDEAHGTGVYGPQRSGLISELDLSDRVEIQMATLGKAIGSAGGAICGSRTLIDFLINRGRSFIYSTAPSPAVSAASMAALELVQDERGEDRHRRLWENVLRFLDGLPDRWRDSVAARPMQSPIVPLIFGDNDATLQAAERLRSSGLFVAAIRFPTVPRGKARLRVTMTASHLPEQIEMLNRELAKIA